MSVKISVITAVYNPGEHIGELLDSLVGQSLPADEFEVIFADDDSTDGTRERLQEFAAGRENFTVLHNSPNSGWPGKPRNMAIDIAKGEYVFIVDHDDWLPEKALEKMWDYARANNSDVVVAKEIGHGHTVPWSLFRENIPNAQLGVDPLLRLMTPHKLFRTAMLNEHGIRFPEGRVRLEDHLFVIKAYFAADVISLYSDYACYHWVHRDDGNASLRGVQPESYYRDLEKVLDVVAANTEPGPLRNSLYLQWYRLKMIGWLTGDKLAKHDLEWQQRLFDTIRPIVLERFEPSMDEALDHALRLRAFLVRADRFDLIHELAQREARITSAVELVEYEWRDGRLCLTVSSTMSHSDGTPVTFDKSGDRVLRHLPHNFDGVVPTEILDVTDALGRVTMDLVLRNRETNDPWSLTNSHTSELVPVGAHWAVKQTYSAEIEPSDAFNGQGLPKVTDLLTRTTLVGFGSQRRVPFSEAVVTRDGPASRRVGEFDYTAYGTANYGMLSIRRSTPAIKKAPVAGTTAPAKKAAAKKAAAKKAAAKKAAAKSSSPSRRTARLVARGVRRLVRTARRARTQRSGA